MTGLERRRSLSFTLRSTAQSMGPRARTVDLSGPRTRWGLRGTLGARRLQTSLRLSQSAPSLAHCRPRTHQYLGVAGRTEGCPRPIAPGPRAAPAAWQRRPGPGEGSRCWAAHRGADAAGSVRFAHPAAQHSRQARPRPLSPTTAPGPPLPSRSPALTARRVLKTPAPPSLCIFTFTLQCRVGAENGSDKLGRRASALSWVRTPSQKLRCSPSRLRSGSAGIRRPVFPIACQTVPGSPSVQTPVKCTSRRVQGILLNRKQLGLRASGRPFTLRR